MDIVLRVESFGRLFSTEDIAALILLEFVAFVVVTIRGKMKGGVFELDIDEDEEDLLLLANPSIKE